MYARLFSRKIALYFTWFLLHFNVTPNQATFISLFFSIIGSSFFILGQYKYSIMAAILLQLSYIFDCVDGEIARFTKLGNPKGHYFDRIAEYISSSLIFVGITFGAYRMFNEAYYFIFGFAAVLSILYFRMFSSEKYKILYEYSLKLKENPKASINKKKVLELLKLLHDKIGFFFRIPALTNIITIAAFFNALNSALIFYGTIFPFIAFGNFIYETKMRFNIK